MEKNLKNLAKVTIKKAMQNIDDLVKYLEDRLEKPEGNDSSNQNNKREKSKIKKNIIEFNNQVV